MYFFSELRFKMKKRPFGALFGVFFRNCKWERNTIQESDIIVDSSSNPANLNLIRQILMNNQMSIQMFVCFFFFRFESFRIFIVYACFEFLLWSLRSNSHLHDFFFHFIVWLIKRKKDFDLLFEFRWIGISKID